MTYDVIVIGAGQAGLATAHALKDTGMNYLIVEAGHQACGSWASYYDSLQLFSPAKYSSLPGLAFPGDPHRYPLRDEVVAYLSGYAKHFNFPIRYNTRIEKIERSGTDFILHPSQGESLSTKNVVVASGPFNQPNIPNFKGLSDFKGQVLHTSAYKGPSDIKGRRVAVIGAGNSAVQIAYELSAHKQVVLISRRDPRFRMQRMLGIDVHAWLTYSGLDRLPIGQWLNWEATIPVIDQGKYQAAIKSGQLPLHPMFDAITPQGLKWADKERPFDSLLLATGFKSAPEFLEGLDGLDRLSATRQSGGISKEIPGLYFVGRSWQRSHASATLRGVGNDAKYVIKKLLDQRKSRR